MEALRQPAWISAVDYLEGEQQSEVRHEYIAGTIYAMAGASEEHNTIAINVLAELRAHLRGKPCRPFIADMKIRVHIGQDDIFYYPDIMVVCDARDADRYFKRYPRVIIEVLSAETERTDRREKFLNYTRIETLEEYVLIAQDQAEVTILRRANQWHPEIVTGVGEALCLPSLNFTLPLATVYEGVKL